MSRNQFRSNILLLMFLMYICLDLRKRGLPDLCLKAVGSEKFEGGEGGAPSRTPGAGSTGHGLTTLGILGIPESAVELKSAWRGG